MARVHRLLALLLPAAVAACSDPATGPHSLEPATPVASLQTLSGYTPLDLGTLGGAYSAALAMNDAGQVVGVSQTANGEHHAFLWEDGVMTDLTTLGGDYSEAFDVNDLGHVTGISHTASGDRHGFLWRDGQMIDLGALDGLFSHAFDLNNSDQVVGVTRTPDSGINFRAFLWEAGIMHHLGTLGGPTNTWAHAINDAGQVAGRSSTLIGQFYPHAFRWQDGVMTDLGTLGGATSLGGGINEAGSVAGTSHTASGEVHGFLWIDGAPMIDLGTLGGTSSQGSLINEANQVAGISSTSTGEQHAFRWADGLMQDLGTLGGTFSNPHAMNEAGHVVGNSRTADDGPFHAFLWQEGIGIRDLGTLGGTGILSGVGSAAYDINNTSQIVGRSKNAAEQERATLWRPLTPVELLEGLAADVEALHVDGTFNKGQATSLINKLNIATAMLNDGKTTPAIKLLQAFIGEVEAMVETGVLTAGEGQELIDGAQAAIDGLA